MFIRILLRHDIGKARKEIEKGENITKNYVDLVVYKEAKLAELERLMNLLDTAVTTLQILDISNRISIVQVEINKVSSEINTCDTMNEYSKVTLAIYEKKDKVTLRF